MKKWEICPNHPGIRRYFDVIVWDYVIHLETNILLVSLKLKDCLPHLFYGFRNKYFN